jgi:hypothetical protein
MFEKLCGKCNQIFPVSFFRSDMQGRNGQVKEYFRPECKRCEKKLSEQLKKAKLQATKKPNQCECCGKFDDLVLDHDHETGKFRGWLCDKCNLGIGRLGDNLQGVVSAVNYLLKSRSVHLEEM